MATMITEETMQSLQAERDKRILRLRKNYIQKFAMMDQTSVSPSPHSKTLPSSSNARPTESTIRMARTSELAEVIDGSSNGASAGINSTSDDVTPKNAPASSPAQAQRRDSKTAHVPESTSLPTPPASTTNEPQKCPGFTEWCVFSNGEILETILLELRIEHILVRAMRVCKGWKDTIDSSKRLQEALYLRPLPNPVEPRGEHFYEKRGECKNAIQVLENPLLRHPRSILEDFEKFSHMQGRTGESTSQRQRRKARQKALMRPEASWRRMLAFQPPVLNIDVEHDTCINIDGIENRHGITMRDMAGDGYLYWRTGCYPIDDLYRSMRCFKLARNISRTEYDPTDELDHGFGWQASFEVPSDAEDEAIRMRRRS